MALPRSWAAPAPAAPPASGAAPDPPRDQRPALDHQAPAPPPRRDPRLEPSGAPAPAPPAPPPLPPVMRVDDATAAKIAAELLLTVCSSAEEAETHLPPAAASPTYPLAPATTPPLPSHLLNRPEPRRPNYHAALIAAAATASGGGAYPGYAPHYAGGGAMAGCGLANGLLPARDVRSEPADNPFFGPGVRVPRHAKRLRSGPVIYVERLFGAPGRAAAMVRCSLPLAACLCC